MRASALKEQVVDMLERAGLGSAAHEAVVLLDAATSLDRARLAADPDLDEPTVRRVLGLAARRADMEPLQYITGIAGFRYLDLAVGPGVFIPRPETEVVAERAMALLPPGGTIVDVGTGSGAIALAVASERPDARVLATESSIEALRWAKRNRSSVGVEVELLSGRGLEPLPGSLREAVDVVVSNPPYIAPEEAAELPEDVVGAEPHLALFAGEGGLEVLRALTRTAPEWLRDGGWLVVEIGATQGDAAVEAFSAAGFVSVSVVPDLQGRDRVVQGQKVGSHT